MSKNLANILIRIEGMTCVNCENKIEKTLGKIKGIESVNVSYAKGRAVVTFDPRVIDQASIEAAIESLDYRVVRDKPATAPSIQRPPYQLIGIGIILVALFVILNQFGGFSIFNAFPQAEAGMGYGLLFVVGLLTSLHCVAMCGGINLSQCVRIAQPSTLTSIPGRFASLKPSFMYNAGRVVSYTLIGGLVGALGSVISFSGKARGLVAIIAGIFMVIMGLNLLNIFPWLRRFNPRMPRIFARKINEQKASGNRSPFYIGLLNGLMPCGPLQAMQLFALSTGSLTKGALSMFFFSLGTVPLMFGIGALSSILSRKFTQKMMQVSAMLVIILGVVMFQNGLGLSGLALPTFAKTTKTTSQSTAPKLSVPVVENGVQLITTKLTSSGYEPITVQQGIPVKWTIQAAEGTITGCNNRLIIPEYNIEKALVVGDNIIEFTPAKSGVIPYSCWMGMIRSKITVVANDGTPTASSSNTAAAAPETATGSASVSGLPSCCGTGLSGPDANQAQSPSAAQSAGGSCCSLQ